MSKTITLENPITMVMRWFAKRKIQKLKKQIDSRNNTINKLEAKYNLNASTPSSVKSTQEVKSNQVEQTTDKLRAKMLTLDNKIIAKSNNRNSNLHLDKGRIDEVIEMLEKTPTKDLVVSTKNGKTRVFLNSPNPLKIARVKKFLKNHGDYELEVA